MNEEQEVSVGVVGHDQQLLVQFSDGQYEIPQHALAQLVCSEHLIKIAPDLCQKTFRDPISAVRGISQKQALSSIHRAIVSNQIHINRIAAPVGHVDERTVVFFRNLLLPLRIAGAAEAC